MRKTVLTLATLFLASTSFAQDEADFQKGKISVTSPIGKGLLGKEVKDIVEIQVPAGKLRLEVIKILREF